MTTADIANLSVNLVKKLYGADKDVLICPMSIATSMGLIAAGAKGETLGEIRAEMFPTSLNLQLDMTTLLGTIQTGQTEAVEFCAPVQLYLAKTIAVHSAFKHQSAWKRYGQVLKAFRGDQAEEFKSAANRSIEDQTGGKVANLLKSADPDSRLMVLSAGWIRAAWKFPFRTRDTTKGEFHTDRDSTPTEVVMMNLYCQPHLTYASNDQLDCQVVGIPLQGDQLWFHLLLPRQRVGLKNLVEKITGESLLNAIHSGHAEKLTVRLPKFNSEFDANLVSTLAHLGIFRLFNPAQSDLSGMADQPGLKVDKLPHGAAISVTERGLDASQSEVIWHPATVDHLDEHNTTEVSADHPFLYALSHKPTGAILLIGTLTNPKAE